MEARVRGATTVTALAHAIDAIRAESESKIVSIGLGSFAHLSTEVRAQLETGFSSVMAEARLWTDLESAVSTEAMAGSAADFRTRVAGAVDVFFSSMPDEAQLTAVLTPEAMVRLALAFGAGAHLH